MWFRPYSVVLSEYQIVNTASNRKLIQVFNIIFSICVILSSRFATSRAFRRWPDKYPMQLATRISAVPNLTSFIVVDSSFTTSFVSFISSEERGSAAFRIAFPPFCVASRFCSLMFGSWLKQNSLLVIEFA